MLELSEQANSLLPESHMTTGDLIAPQYNPETLVTLYWGDCLDLLRSMPANEAQLVVTSPPYNIGKRYETRRTLEAYLADQAEVIAECVRVLRPGGSICWQVGNHMAGAQEVLPLDIALYPIFAGHGLKLRNRLIWHFEHGLHCSKRFSGRYETILWFTKGDDYTFNLDPVRVPQKYPGKKHYRGPKVGQLSGNPLGKNPGDFWTMAGDVWVFPNVKHNHIEKTTHPCQFPVELVERLVLALTDEDDLVIDPYIGVGSTAIAALVRGRRSAGADTMAEYIEIARDRVVAAAEGRLQTRPIEREVYKPPARSPEAKAAQPDRLQLQLS